jgi:D-alanyl-D-alanine carboxypeptidase
MWSWVLNLLLTLVLLRTNTGSLINSDVRILKPSANLPELSLMADKGAVLTANDRTFLYCKNADVTQPIASITKLMTALVFLENNPGFETTYTVTRDDQIPGGILNLFPGDIVKVKDILKTSLIASDNGATVALVHSTGMSEQEFVVKMNEKAKQLGLKNTSFTDATGLSDKNVSTAREVAIMAKAALARDEIRTTTETKDYQFTTVNGINKKIESTDNLLFDSAKNNFQIMGGKTGFTDKAGYCFVGWFKDPSGREVISVVLNSNDKNGRFKESKSLVNWVFSNYSW